MLIILNKVFKKSTKPILEGGYRLLTNDNITAVQL